MNGRAALGVDVQFTSRLYAFSNVAYERFPPLVGRVTDLGR